MQWRIILCAIVIVTAFAISNAEAGQKKKGAQPKEQDKRSDTGGEHVDTLALDALIEHFKKSLGDAREPPDLQHDPSTKQRHGVIIRYLTRTIDFLKLYGWRPLRHT